MSQHPAAALEIEVEHWPEGDWTALAERAAGAVARVEPALANARLEAIVAERNRQWRRYQEQLSGLPLQLLQIPEGVRSALHLAVVRLSQATPQEHRMLFTALRSAGIGVQLHYSPVHLQPYYRRRGFGEGQFPEAVAYARTAISLPLFPGLTQAEQERVVRVLKRELQRQGLGC